MFVAIPVALSRVRRRNRPLRRTAVLRNAWCSWSLAPSRGVRAWATSRCSMCSSPGSLSSRRRSRRSRLADLWERLRATQHLRLAAALAALCVDPAGVRSRRRASSACSRSDRRDYAADTAEPASTAISQLPSDAKTGIRMSPARGGRLSEPRGSSASTPTRAAASCRCVSRQRSSAPFSVPQRPRQMPKTSFFRRAPQRIALSGRERPSFVGRRRGLPEAPRHRLHLCRCQAPELPGGRRRADRDGWRCPADPEGPVKGWLSLARWRPLHCPRMSSQRHLGEAAAS